MLGNITTTDKNDNNRKGGYFRFDDDNNVSYRYILSITYTETAWLPNDDMDIFFLPALNF